MTEQTSHIEEEVESWEGFPWALLKGGARSTQMGH